MTSFRHAPLALAGCLLAVGLAGSSAQAAAGCPAEPNVVFLVDTSGSMANVVWHPAFDPLAPVTCSDFTAPIMLGQDTTQVHCGTVRTYYVDPALQARGIPTRYDPVYLNWLHDLPDGHPYLAEIAAPDSGVLPACLGGGTHAAYKESRMSAAQRFVLDVACRTTSAGDPRLGLARPRGGSDPAGGYVSEPVDDDTPVHAAAFEASLAELEPNGWGPLGESLFHVYTYSMSRSPGEQPLGVDGFTAFPAYTYDTFGNPSAIPPPTPVTAECQEQIVVVLADDAPTRDTFDPGIPGGEAFGAFHDLIGNYNPDDVWPEAGNEEPGSSPTCESSCEVALYLDDIALFMYETDFAPTLAGVQRVRTYTVSFGREPFGMALLEKTAVAGGGLFLLPSDAALLADEIIAAGSAPPSVPALGVLGRLGAVLALAVTAWGVRRRGAYRVAGD